MAGEAAPVLRVKRRKPGSNNEGVMNADEAAAGFTEQKSLRCDYNFGSNTDITSDRTGPECSLFAQAEDLQSDAGRLAGA